jgi:alpha-tubulin suppressor-like RCC1 family protein
LKRDGTVAIWGSVPENKGFVEPPGWLADVVAITAGRSQTLALRRDGTVVGWGGNRYGQATGVPTTNSPGDNVTVGQVTLNGKVLDGVVAVAASTEYGLVLNRDGTVVAWGGMYDGSVPVTVPAGLKDVVAISAGPTFCLALTTNAAVAAKFVSSGK